MAIASAKAETKSIGTRILPADSGLRPIDSMALAPILPIARAGAKPPMAIAAALAINVRSIWLFPFLIIIGRSYFYYFLRRLKLSLINYICHSEFISPGPPKAEPREAGRAESQLLRSSIKSRMIGLG